ncbi:Glucosamine-phosphate N-acetyltransferase-like protein [Rhizophlyctis rosea]|uniref:Glucosamine 6-phosphate N-acetyltransferase n=1 Tax=Rhizophlyctis rosea TaxID=64517 RepID=A0AAD5X5J0_9FUNG|nr:Glucosamine-phosphate N-acetyltransferase-like protein [Rhizophlyctis rosea]
MSMDEPLFNPVYISPEVQRSLKEGFVVRPLAASDYEKGFLDCLSQLTTVGSLTKGQFMERFSYLKSHNYEYFTIVIEDTKKKLIVGAGTIFVERKFVHGNGLVGHIEDIVTLSDYRGLNLGKLVIETLKYVGKHTGCYKIILDCSDKNIPFYQKCGFAHKEFEMVLYIDENDRAKAKL